eukprot:TRINITY_DN11665_c0_g2_i4.p1 TRINITY_DN11665_c0_g2~~TRINITY_DN11665_c0_g2_i4.p1  ORF type:complete len:234 (-),score=10.08 TRINITY_DN11665_c0_g2_i4:219-920(-)
MVLALAKLRSVMLSGQPDHTTRRLQQPVRPFRHPPSGLYRCDIFHIWHPLCDSVRRRGLSARGAGPKRKRGKKAVHRVCEPNVRDQQVTPSMEAMEKTKLHSLFFLQYPVFRFLAVFAHFVEAEKITACQRLYIIVYGLLSFVQPGAAFYATQYWTPGLPNYRDWSGDPENGVLINPLIMMSVDYSWFVCILLTSVCTPASRPLHVTTCLGEIGDVEYQPGPVEENEGHELSK